MHYQRDEGSNVHSKGKKIGLESALLDIQGLKHTWEERDKTRKRTRKEKDKARKWII